MNQKIICGLVILAVLLSVETVVAPEPIPPPTPGPSGSGVSRLTLESFTKNLESWQKDKPTKYQYMTKLLSKGNPTAYKDPSIGLKYSKNKTINRNEELEIKFQVQNPNPIDLRMPLFVDLEVLVPGTSGFKKVNQNSMVVQPFAYTEQHNVNFSESSWPEVSTINQMDKVGLIKLKMGEIKFRAVYTDGSRKKYSSEWKYNPPYYGELVLNLTNRPPEMRNLSLVAPNQTRYNDPIEYKATIDDPEGDMLNVTLHILNDKGKELKNETQNVKPGDVSFKSGEYGFFSESDAGKNFTYYYSFDDGINSNKTENKTGPSIRRGPKLYVDKLNVTPESESCNWWNWYTFNIRAKNLNPEEYDVVFTLFTKTENGDWNSIESKTVKVGQEPQMIYFNKTKPFTVADANSSFLYRIKLSEYDQTGKDVLEADGLRINAKIVPYSIYNPVMFLNLVPMLFLILLGSFFVERKLKKGNEAHESASGKTGDRKNNKQERRGKSGGSFTGKVLKMLRRG
jgi:hypothetical protein